MEVNEVKTKVPEGWYQTQLGRLFIERKKSRIKVKEAFPGGQYPFFTSGENILSRNDYLSEGSHLFLATGGIANVKFFDGKASYSSDTYCIAGKDGNTKFLFYTILKNLFYINYHFFEGSGLKHLQKANFKKFKILFPKDLKEQQKIAEVLTTIDEAIEKTDAIIEKNKRIKQGLMHDLFRYGIDEHGNIRSEKTHKFKTVKMGNEEMRIPEGWEISTFDKIAQRITTKHNPTTGVNLPCINLDNIVQNTGKLFNTDESINNLSIKTAFEIGDILFGKLRPYLRKYYYAEFKGVCTTEIIVFRKLLNTDRRYIYYLVSSIDFVSYVNSRTFGTKMPRTDWNIIRQYTFAKPPATEQRCIAEILLFTDLTIEKEQIYKQKLLSLKRGLMEDLLTGTVRVNNLMN